MLFGSNCDWLNSKNLLKKVPWTEYLFIGAFVRKMQRGFKGTLA
jgi:hypothetical protein